MGTKASRKDRPAGADATAQRKSSDACSVGNGDSSSATPSDVTVALADAGSGSSVTAAAVAPPASRVVSDVGSAPPSPPPTIRVLLVAGEASPFAATGGLADVAGSLPRALNALGADVRVAIPCYSGSSSVATRIGSPLRFVGSFTVPLAWRQQYCGVFETEYRGVTYYLIDNEQYFGRGNIYGYGDDGERFAFFSKAALEMLGHVGFAPNVIHANDWHTGAAPLFFRAQYGHLPQFAGTKTVFTIHNIQYQGQMGHGALADLLGLGAEWRSLVEYDGCLNMVKAGIEASDAVTTVSPTYAREITTPTFGHGLDRILSQRSSKLTGVLNGIDTESYDPTGDAALAATFSASDTAGKRVCKADLQHRLGLDGNPSAPLVAMVTRLTEAKGIDLVEAVFHEAMVGDESAPQFAILGSGDRRYERFLSGMAEAYPGRVAVHLGFHPDLARRMYAGADIFLMPSRTEACGLAQMIALRYGALPLVRETGGLSDSIKSYDESTGQGNGFTFASYNAHDMLHTLRRAFALYGQPELWQSLVVRALECDFGWGKSAEAYLGLYAGLVGG